MCWPYVQGTIPSTISNLVTLNELNMSYNFGVVGFLPREVGSMANLTVLHIYSAGIHGELCDMALVHLCFLGTFRLLNNRWDRPYPVFQRRVLLGMLTAYPDLPPRDMLPRYGRRTIDGAPDMPFMFSTRSTFEWSTNRLLCFISKTGSDHVHNESLSYRTSNSAFRCCSISLPSLFGR